MKLSLIVQNEGKTKGQAIPVKTTQFVIGRDPGCNLRPASAMISKRHCAVLIKEDKVFLRDFGSTNGTYVNDKKVEGEVPLANGDAVKVGPLLFKVQLDVAATVSKPTPVPPAKVPAGAPGDDDAAALLLSMEDGLSTATTDTAEAEVPGGSTIMEMPAFNVAGAPQDPAKPDAAKKPDEKPKHDSAQQAAQAILEKLRRGQRR